MTVTVKCLVKEWTKGNRVTLSNGVQAFLPKEQSAIGSEVDMDELIMTPASGKCYVLKSSLPKPRVLKNIPEPRDMSNFDVAFEMNLIQACILRKRNILGDSYVIQNLEDLKSEAFTYMWKSRVFHQYDEKKSFGYSSYIATTIERWMINLVRDGNFRRDQFLDSLDFKLDSSDEQGNSATVESLFPDERINLETSYEVQELEHCIEAFVMGMGECPLLPGIFYSDLYYELSSNGSIPQFARDHGVSYRKINASVEELRSSLKKYLELTSDVYQLYESTLKASQGYADYFKQCKKNLLLESRISA